MLRTIEAVIEPDGQVRLLEPISISGARRALVTVLDEPAEFTVLLSEPALMTEWNRPEEDAAWEHLQGGDKVVIMSEVQESKFDHITRLALARVRAGMAPDVAWVETLRELHSGKALASQAKHTCPKWAFSILCHEGKIQGVRPGCCPAAQSSRSAAYTLAALDLIRADPSLASNTRELIRRVFGVPGRPGSRKPNDEVEVLLALHKTGVLEIG